MRRRAATRFHSAPAGSTGPRATRGEPPLRFYYHRGVCWIGGYVQWTGGGLPPANAVIAAIPLGFTVPTNIYTCARVTDRRCWSG